ncbi:MAG: hypothetical protein BWY19_00615 [bacterium ADurb.Bin212]|nr:MAG: hypothetical protein BWY19_00615 [bacterium ADurb.Bin212]
MSHSTKPQTLVLVLKKDEEIVAEIKKYCQTNKITGGWLSGLGAVSGVELAFYNLKDKRFTQKKIDQELEIVSLVGNVATLDNDTTTHIHAVLSDINMKPIAGHLISATVAATCEIKLEVFDQAIKRKYNDHIGLNLIGG